MPIRNCFELGDQDIQHPRRVLESAKAIARNITLGYELFESLQCGTCHHRGPSGRRGRMF